jgi:hypothetical protein
MYPKVLRFVSDATVCIKAVGIGFYPFHSKTMKMTEADCFVGWISNFGLVEP